MSKIIVDPVAVESSQSDDPGTRQARVLGRRPSSCSPQADVARRVFLDVWKDGAPAHIPAATLKIDLTLYAHLACAGCGKRTLSVKAQHKGVEHYRILATCRTCGSVATF